MFPFPNRLRVHSARELEAFTKKHCVLGLGVVFGLWRINTDLEFSVK
jgi:hypothetical protein